MQPTTKFVIAPTILPEVFGIMLNMRHYQHTTQTPNILFDDLLKTLSESELKVLLTIIRKTVGQADKNSTTGRKPRAWITQKLFCICTGLSNTSVSKAVDSLVGMNLIRVSNAKNSTLKSKDERRGTFRLYYESCLQLSTTFKKASEHSSHNAVKKLHTIKLNTIKQSCEHSSQGIRRLSDVERFRVLQHKTSTPSKNDASRFGGNKR